MNGGGADFSDPMTCDKDKNDSSVNSLRARTVFSLPWLLSVKYDVGQENGLTLEYKAMLAGAAMVNT